MSQPTIIRLIYFFVFACQGAWLPRFADYLVTKNIGGWQMATILSLTPLLMFLIQPWYGLLTDKIGYKKSLLFATFIAALSYPLFVMEGSVVFIMATTIIMSISFNATMPILDSLAMQLSNRESSFSYGTLRIAGAMGWSAMGLAAGYIIERYNLLSTFYIASASMWLAFLLTFLLKSEPNNIDVQAKVKASEPVLGLLKNKTLMLYMSIIAMCSICMTAVWNFYSMYMTSIKASATLTGYGLSLQGLCELPLFYFSGAIIARFNLKMTLIITMVITGLRMLLYSVVDDASTALWIELLHGVSWSLFWVACVEVTDKLVDDKYKATGQSILYAAYFGIGTILGNYWTTYLISFMTLDRIFYINAGIMAAIGVFAYLSIKIDDRSLDQKQ